MRFLVDQPVSPLLADWLRGQAHDAVHVRDVGLSRAEDDDLFALAVREDRIIVTADLDFSRILALSGRDRPGLILFRAGTLTDAETLNLLRVVCARVAPDVLERSVVVVDRAGLRVARLPLRPDLAE